ncbi:MAG: glycosyltransferase [Acidobacteria bacterium]|nr:glycosyltransferase [Acidobacteriota bacterium]
MFSLHIDTVRTWRGGQQQALLTVLGLRERGHRAVLVAHPDGELYKRAAEGPDLIGLAPMNEIDLAAAWKLSRILKQYRPDLVHAHDPHAVAMAATALSFGAVTPTSPLVASRRVDFHLSGNSFSRWKYRQVSRFIAASGAIAEILIHDGIPASQVSVVHDGIDVEKVQGIPVVDIRSEFWLPHGVPVVVNVGALVAHKGQRYLIDAMPLVMRRVPDAHLVILGEGDLRGALERQVKDLHLEKVVRLPGFREDVLGLAKAADMFVMSSITEGLGSAVLDAMAMGLPVVGTRAGGIPEAVVHEETGLLVPPADAEALAAAMVRVLTDAALRQRFGAAGRTRVADHFDVAALVEGTLAVYASESMPKGNHGDTKSAG